MDDESSIIPAPRKPPSNSRLEIGTRLVWITPFGEVDLTDAITDLQIEKNDLPSNAPIAGLTETTATLILLYDTGDRERDAGDIEIDNLLMDDFNRWAGDDDDSR